jgi:hypothetical protein
MRQLMGTARMLKAEWKQVLLESVSTGTKEEESSTGHVWVPGFHHVMAHSHVACNFETYEPFISLIFKCFFLRPQ